MTVAVLRYSAFTRDGRGGNPAGVVLNAECLADSQMLSIAQAIGYSTAFVLPGSPAAGDLRVRYFSPRAEVAFCGHATVATAVALAERDGPGQLHLTTLAGTVAVRTAGHDDGFTATLTSPPARSAPMETATTGRLLAAMRWSRQDLDPAFPVHVAFAGNSHAILAVRERGTLARFLYDHAGLGRLMAECGWTTVHAFWAQTPALFHARNAFPPGGVVEDPATGAAAAAFGGYLRAVLGTGAPARLTVLQGEDMGHPSRLLVGLDTGTDGVDVSGTATRLALSAYDDLEAL